MSDTLSSSLTLSPQGIETTSATNRVGYFVLTNILLPPEDRHCSWPCAHREH